MPLYEYQCQSCEKRTEVLQRFDDAPLAACPECGGEVKKLPSAPAVQFKGSGWYVTDYAGKGKAPAAPEGKGSEAKGTKETKPDSAKAETSSSSASSSSSSSGNSSSGSSGGSDSSGSSD
ncbi:MAG TPA: FmdB family zinc ribbon protein [Thermoanaerobaculia bacterium]